MEDIKICGVTVAEAQLQYRDGGKFNQHSAPFGKRSWSLGVQINILNSIRFQVKLAGSDTIY